MKRLAPQDRKAAILAAALILAEKQGYQKITRESVATQARVSPALVSHYFNAMDDLRAAVMREAVRVENLAVVLQGITAKDPAISAASTWLKAKAINSMTEL